MITITDEALSLLRNEIGHLHSQLANDRDEATIAQSKLVGEVERLREQLVKAQQTLKEIAAAARFEQDHPSELRDTAFYLIEKKARAHLTDEEGK